MKLTELLTQRGVRGGAVRALFARVAGAGLAFLVGVVVARQLGPEGAGVYFLAITLATIASVVGRIGLDQLLVRRIAAAREEADHGRLLAVGAAGRRLAVLGSFVASGILYAAAPLLAEHVFPLDGLARALRVAALGVAPLSLVLISSELLRGIGRAGSSQAVATALLPGATFGALVLAILIFGATPAVALGAWVIGAVTAAFLSSLFWRRATASLVVEPTTPSPALRALGREALPFLGVAVLALALPWISVLGLALGGDEAQVGLFAVAYRTATLTSFVLLAVNAAVAPRFAALVARKDHAALARTARRAALATALCALPLIVGAWAAPDHILALFGPEFAAGGKVLAILATGQLVNVATGSVGSLLLMSGHERALRKNLIGATLLSLVLHVWLVPAHGAEGAAWASAAGIAVLNVASLVDVRRLLRIDVLPLPFLRPANAHPGSHA